MMSLSLGWNRDEYEKAGANKQDAVSDALPLYSIRKPIR